MIGDEESTEFISEVVKIQEKKPLKPSSKRQSINGLIYCGGVLIFLCIIILLFWRVSKKRFHKQDTHLLVISSIDLDFLQLSDTKIWENCTQNQLDNENTLVIISNNIVDDSIVDCIDQYKNKISDKILIVYNATQDSFRYEQDNTIMQYYLSDQELQLKNSKVQKITKISNHEQIDVVGQIINNIFK